MNLIIIALFVLVTPAFGQLCTYDIDIRTECGLGTGTDGYVSVQIWDSWAPSFEKPSGSLVFSGDLDNPGNDFESCKTDKYKITNKQCINFCSMRLTLSIKGGFAELSAPWRPDYVKVSGNNITRTFPINRWLNPNTPRFQANAAIAVVDQCTTTASGEDRRRTSGLIDLVFG